MQRVELHYRCQPTCDFAVIRARAQEILDSEITSPNPGEEATEQGAFLFLHTQHPVTYADGNVLPAQTAILSTDRVPDLEIYRKDIQQSWLCRQAEDLLRESTATLLVVEMMARTLPPADRVAIFHGVLQAMIEATSPEALAFRYTQQIIAPGDYLAACTDQPILRPGSLNVRFFNIANSPGDMLMDTRGLDEIGLHDLQCHFRDLEPNAVSQVLYNTAVYIFENGPVIESGQTVEGIAPNRLWRCQFESSLVEPTREVLDLNPGAPFAAGNRAM